MEFDVIQHNLSGCMIINFVLYENCFEKKTLVIGLIFALTSTTDGIRRNTAQPFRLQDKNLVL